MLVVSKLAGRALNGVAEEEGDSRTLKSLSVVAAATAAVALHNV
jgi:hypothetical protein